MQTETQREFSLRDIVMGIIYLILDDDYDDIDNDA